MSKDIKQKKEVNKMTELLYNITVIILSLALRGLLVMLLWNWVVVGLFGAPAVSYLLAVGVGMVLGFIGNFFKKN